MKPGTAIMMLILASILNYALLKFLTIKVAPVNVIKGKRGAKGEKGLQGNKGKVGLVGKPASRKIFGNNDRLLGRPGPMGNDGEPASCTENLDKYCIIEEDSKVSNDYGKGSHMNLVGYRARTLPNVCLFGYNEGVDTSGKKICEPPESRNILPNSFPDCPVGVDKKCITHIINRKKTNIIDKSSESFFPKNVWAPSNSRNDRNCAYVKDEINKMTPPQFNAWARLLSNRNCPGVPVNGTVNVPNRLGKNRNKNWPDFKCVSEETNEYNKNYYFGYYNQYSRERGAECTKYINEIDNPKKWYKVPCNCLPQKLKLGKTCRLDKECESEGLFNPTVRCTNNVCTEV